MGATSIRISQKGKNIEHAFRLAQEEAQRLYGIDPYNGQINNCELWCDVTEWYNEAKDKNTFINEWLKKIEKRMVVGVKLTNDLYLFFGWAPE